MLKYDKNAIAAAFSTVARLVREGQPVVLRKVEGLNNVSQVMFKAAVTHNFNTKDHGVNLQKIFIVDSKDKNHWTRNTGAKDNPKDIELVDRIMQAMTAVRKLQKIKRQQKLQMPKVEEPAIPVITVKKDTETLPEKETVMQKYPAIKDVPLFGNPATLNNEALEYAIQKTIYTLDLLKAEQEKRNAKKAELLKTVQELLAGEGFTLEDLIGLVWVRRKKF